ncbi:hypothetical protein ZEAMMB73_Zm00001d002032 [Zea mays]|nr:hypothetical protein ZEAMMB73_Zm00001d002032 [Zea mays]
MERNYWQKTNLDQILECAKGISFACCNSCAAWRHKRSRGVICLLCRERGHSLKNCPDKSEGNLKKFC